MRSVLLIRNKLFGVRVTVTNFSDIIHNTIIQVDPCIGGSESIDENHGICW